MIKKNTFAIPSLAFISRQEVRFTKFLIWISTNWLSLTCLNRCEPMRRFRFLIFYWSSKIPITSYWLQPTATKWTGVWIATNTNGKWPEKLSTVNMTYCVLCAAEGGTHSTLSMRTYASCWLIFGCARSLSVHLCARRCVRARQLSVPTMGTHTHGIWQLIGRRTTNIRHGRRRGHCQAVSGSLCSRLVLGWLDLLHYSAEWPTNRLQKCL